MAKGQKRSFEEVRMTRYWYEAKTIESHLSLWQHKGTENNNQIDKSRDIKEWVTSSGFLLLKKPWPVAYRDSQVDTWRVLIVTGNIPH